MASNQSQGSARQHSGRNSGHKRQRRIRCPWTTAELISLRYQAAQRIPWGDIAKSFTINGFVRHHSLECHKKWCQLFRDNRLNVPQPEVTRQEESEI